MNNKIYIGSDHAGYKRKTDIIKWLKKNNYEVVDLGTDNEISTDYPIYGKLVAENTVSDEGSFGIVVCGSGNGISIAANKVQGARAVNLQTIKNTKLSREHNNANIAAIGGRLISKSKANKLINVFLNTPFDGGERHLHRVELLNKEKNC